MADAPMKAAMLAAMKDLVPLAINAVGREKARRAVYDYWRHLYGEAQIGPWEDYETKERGHWSLEACKADARRFETRKAWEKGSRSAYTAACRNGWLDQCCGHMTKRETVAMGHWTLDRCKADARRFETRTGWSNDSEAAYSAARRKGWLDDCCAHMPKLEKVEKGHWTLDQCRADANRFSTRNTWAQASPGAYRAAHRNGWLDECCQHMPPVTAKERCEQGHWTFDRCMSDALRFETRKAWKMGSPGAYSAALRNGWLDECCAHMTEVAKPTGYWTFDRCMSDALRFETRKAWGNGSPGGYGAAQRNGWLDECCQHMRLGTGFWTQEACRADALRFKTRRAWRKGSESAFKAARKNGWLDLCFVPMTGPMLLHGTWTRDKCRADALRFNKRSAWRHGSPGAYRSACRNGWLDECCGHMRDGRASLPTRMTATPSAPRPVSTPQQHLATMKTATVAKATRFASLAAWIAGDPDSHRFAASMGWLDDCTAHMAKQEEAA